MKKKTRFWIAGVLLLAAGVSLFAVYKTKSLKIDWKLDDEDFGENLCQNCNC